MTATFCPDCTLCPRLSRFLVSTAHKFPDYHCKPVAPFGEAAPKLLIVGLAPGMHGANRTGRPFTGDHAGILLYASLHALGLSSAPTSVDRADGLKLHGVRITNAVKCLPPREQAAAGGDQDLQPVPGGGTREIEFGHHGAGVGDGGA